MIMMINVRDNHCQTFKNLAINNSTTTIIVIIITKTKEKSNKPSALILSLTDNVQFNFETTSQISIIRITKDKISCIYSKVLEAKDIAKAKDFSHKEQQAITIQNGCLERQDFLLRIITTIIIILVQRVTLFFNKTCMRLCLYSLINIIIIIIIIKIISGKKSIFKVSWEGVYNKTKAREIQQSIQGLVTLLSQPMLRGCNLILQISEGLQVIKGLFRMGGNKMFKIICNNCQSFRGVN